MVEEKKWYLSHCCQSFRRSQLGKNEGDECCTTTRFTQSTDDIAEDSGRKRDPRDTKNLDRLESDQRYDYFQIPEPRLILNVSQHTVFPDNS